MHFSCKTVNKKERSLDFHTGTVFSIIRRYYIYIPVYIGIFCRYALFFFVTIKFLSIQLRTFATTSTMYHMYITNTTHALNLQFRLVHMMRYVGWEHF